MTAANPFATRARLYIFTVAVLFSTAGAGIKSVTFSSWQIAGLRSAFAIVGLLVLIPPGSRQRSWPSTILVGVVYAANMILFVVANKLTTAANTIYLQSAAPLYVLLLGPWLLREPVRTGDLIFMVIVGIGMVLFFVDPGPSYATAPNPLIGNIIAAAGGLAWALTVIGLRWMGTRSEVESTRAALITGNVITVIVCLPLGAPPTTAHAADWIVVAYLGLVQVSLAYALLTRAMAYVPALEASLLLLLEPVLNPVWAWALHGERPGATALAGGAIILSALAMRALRAFSFSPRPTGGDTEGGLT